MRKDERLLSELAVLAMKALLYLLLCGTFFLHMEKNNPQIMLLSRTAAVSLLMFFAFGLAMLSVYGGFAVGRQKSKPIIISLSLATAMTDAMTYLQLQIMNVNAARNDHLVLFGPDIWLLLRAFIVQVVLIVLFVRAANRIYFRFHAPQACLLVARDVDAAPEIARKIERLPLQYAVGRICGLNDPELDAALVACDTVFLCGLPVAERTRLTERAYAMGKNVYARMDLADAITYGAEHVILDDLPFLDMESSGLSIEQRFVKRAMDIAVSLPAVVLLSPLMLLCALAIKCGDRGPVIYRQKRATRAGRVFEIYKFRTMRPHGGEGLQHSATKDDDRITPVGRVLRRCRLDELPQLFNILKGDMSLVGPRPEMLENVMQYTRELPEFSYRLKVKAGLTGYAQIEGKYNTSPRDKMILDMLYIERYSAWLDVKLLLRTLTVFFKSDSTEAFGDGPAKEKDGPSPKSAENP